jgi:hypothetical protein
MILSSEKIASNWLAARAGRLDICGDENRWENITSAIFMKEVRMRKERIGLAADCFCRGLAEVDRQKGSSRGKDAEAGGGEAF